MVKYYKLDIIPIILNRFKVNNVVLCGAFDEKTIALIMDYCNNGASYIVIDSQENQDEKVINDYPLNVLPNLNDFDAIFLNDDPNWYTVFQELNIIKKNNQEFPLVFICHNIFPNKRRDSYTNPDIIPKEFLNEYSKELDYDNVVVRDGFFHAIEENTPKNGVSTAIEDFLIKNSSIGMMDIKFLNGMTILYFDDNISKIRLGKLAEEIEGYELNDDLSDSIVENQILTNHIKKFKLNNDNLEVIENLNVKLDEKEKIITDFKNQITIQNNKLSLKDSQIENFDSKWELKETQIKNIESKLVNRNLEIKDLNNQLKIAVNEINSLKNKEAELNNQISRYNSQINSLKSDIYKLEKKESESNNKLQIVNNEIQDNINKLNYKNEVISIKDNQIKEKELEIAEKEHNLNFFKQQYTNQLSKLDTKEYCISCYQEEIANNQLEIEYLKKDSLIRKILSPFAYIYLLFKSKPNELFLNFKLYRSLKNSKCFDIGFYLNKNNDLQDSKWCDFFSPELHYVCRGFSENRKFNKKFFNRNSKEELLDYILNCKY